MKLLLTLAAALAFAAPIEAWGSFGHRTVAYLAEMYLTKEAREYTEHLLNTTVDWDISDAAVWADGRVRRDKPYTYQWHFIDANDNPPHYCGVEYKRDCNLHGKPGCAISAIANMTARLNNPRLSFADQQEAIKFVIHIIGDIHQPLHTELLARGGNDIEILFDKRKTNLHSIWDTNILLKYRGIAASPHNHDDEKRLANIWAMHIYVLNNDSGLSAETECTDIADPQTCALAWATESNRWVCDYVLKDGKAALEKRELSGNYSAGAGPIVEKMIGKAGLRLGLWLNELAAADAKRFALEQGELR